MFIPILLSAILVVRPAIAITLPNGFTFDETQFLNLESRVLTAADKCVEPFNTACSNDCSTSFYCSNYTILSTITCGFTKPYCVKDLGQSPFTMCSSNFPMSNSACLTKSLVNFVCTADGLFPDPTDCSKYHICSGASHTIAECPANHQFISDPNILDPYTNPGNGEFICRFRTDMNICNCMGFGCAAAGNSFATRPFDYHHYAYCFQMGSVRKVMMFKCPSGTSHKGVITLGADGSQTVECLPPGASLR